MKIQTSSSASKNGNVITFSADVNVDGHLAKFSKVFHSDESLDKPGYDFEYIDSKLDLTMKALVLWDKPTVLVVVVKAFLNGDTVATTISHYL